MSFPLREEEVVKTIDSSVVEGKQVLLFDNLPRGWRLKSAKIDNYITSDMSETRILGQTQTAKGPSTGHLIFTGNSVDVAGDTQSRFLRIELELDPDANSMTRTYRHTNLAEFTRDNRGRILGALGALLRATGAGMPAAGRLPRWVAAVAKPLLNASGVDITEDWKGAGLEAEDVGTDLSDLLESIARNGGLIKQPGGAWATGWFTAAEACGHADPNVQDKLARGGGMPTLKTALSVLQGFQNTRHGDFILQSGGKQNLGDRTGRKPRHVFRVEHRPGGSGGGVAGSLPPSGGGSSDPDWPF